MTPPVSRRLSLRHRLLITPLVAVVALVVVAVMLGTSWHRERTASLAVFDTQARAWSVHHAYTALTRTYATVTRTTSVPPEARPVALMHAALDLASDQAAGAEQLLKSELPEAHELHDQIARFRAALERLRQGARDVSPSLTLDSRELSEAYETLDASLRKSVAVTVAAASRAQSDAHRVAERANNAALIALLAAAGQAVLASFFAAQALLGPLQRMLQRTVALVDGDLTTPIPGHGGNDEIGAIADALEVFRRNAQDLHKFAYYDPLTGLGNRARCHQALADAKRELAPGDPPFALLLMDLDRFKEVNDTLGHDVGDDLLKAVAGRIDALLGPGDVAARLGGDEFAIIQRGDLDDILAPKLLETLSRPYELAGQVLHVGVSIGVAMHHYGFDPSTNLLKHADLALYEAKREAGPTFRCFEPRMSEELLDRRRLEEDFRKAIENGDIRFVFQPKLRVRDGRIVGVETLARWRRPDGDLVPPPAFVDVAERTGLIELLGLQALEAACFHGARWYRQAGAEGFHVAVNASVAQFKRRSFCDDVDAILDRAGLAPSALTLELTESLFLDEDPIIQEVMDNLTQLGVRLSLDDFGTGYASLGYLRRLHFTELKIDRTFIRDVEDCDDARSLVIAIIRLAHALDLSVTAEGIETERQLAILAGEDCDLIQGYLVGRPMEAADIDRRLAIGYVNPAPVPR